MKNGREVTWFQCSCVYTTWAEPLNSYTAPFLYLPIHTNSNGMHVINRIFLAPLARGSVASQLVV